MSRHIIFVPLQHLKSFWALRLAEDQQAVRKKSYEYVIMIITTLFKTHQIKKIRNCFIHTVLPLEHTIPCLLTIVNQGESDNM
jgi:hypothetical protein